MTLIQKQKAIVRLHGRLIDWLYLNGYEATMSEWWRSPETCALYAKDGRGINHSLHELRLAFDIELFKDGVFLMNTDLYEPAGKFWESLSTPDLNCCWGGDFCDGNHFSIEHNGVR